MLSYVLAIFRMQSVVVCFKGQHNVCPDSDTHTQTETLIVFNLEGEGSSHLRESDEENP